MFDIKFEKKSLDAFDRRIDKMFDQIQRDMSNPTNMEPVVVDIKDSMKKGMSGIYQNNRYSQAKNTLKARGMIDYNVPFAVTGQLIDDMKMSLMSVSPNEILQSLSFSDVERLRPTIWSMYNVAEGKSNQLDYDSSSSAEVAQALSARYPIMRLIQQAYEDDFVNHINQIISRAIRSS
jgi:hypothetical protein